MHLSIDLLPNVEEYTDGESKWICKEDELKINIEVEAPIEGFIEASSSDSVEKYFEGKLQTGEYLLMKYTLNEEGSSIELEFDEGITADIRVFSIKGNVLHEEEKIDNPKTSFPCYPLGEDESCYILMKVTNGGVGGMKVSFWS